MKVRSTLLIEPRGLKKVAHTTSTLRQGLEGDPNEMFPAAGCDLSADTRVPIFR